MKKRGKRSMSQVITVILLILIVIVAIVIVWNIINIVLTKSLPGQNSSCAPNCSGKQCGPDGCGDYCGSLMGACAQSDYACNAEGKCVFAGTAGTYTTAKLCSTGWADCDSNTVNGCETYLLGDGHCGNCTNNCTSRGQVCSNINGGTCHTPSGSGGSGCTPTLTCPVNYVNQCGISLSDGCDNVLNCSGNCAASGKICNTTTNLCVSPASCTLIWTQRNSAVNVLGINKRFREVKSSSNGSRLFVAGWDNPQDDDMDLYTSSDYGVTWSNIITSPVVSFNHCTLSADGTKLVCGALDSSHTIYYVYTSSNSGATWTSHIVSTLFEDIASSDDGTKVVIATGPSGSTANHISTSSDSGATWTPQTNSGKYFWGSVASSANGSKLAVGVGNLNYSGYIYTSSDSGATWTPRTNSGNHYWESIASSADGTNLAAVESIRTIMNYHLPSSGGYIYTSTDSGATWTPQVSAGNRSWINIASSADGTKLAAIGSNILDKDYIYTSTDSGATWTPQVSAGNRSWIDIASSTDGAKLIAVGGEGDVWTSSC